MFRDSETKICDMVSAEKARLTAAEADKALAVAKSDGLRQSIATQEESHSIDSLWNYRGSMDRALWTGF